MFSPRSFIRALRKLTTLEITLIAVTFVLLVAMA